jgi:glycosyltransferase involved in cell wall biosynthesis
MIKALSSMVDPSPAHPRIVAIMPARNSARTLEDTVRAIPAGYIDQIVLVDNASKDDTVAIAERLGLTVVRHPVDRGFGGSIKSCFRAALAAKADYVVELHPDNQYDPRYLPALLDKVRSSDYVMVIASRFLPARKALEGGMPWWKFVSNRILTFLNGAMLGVRLSEFHSGFRVYRADWIRSIPFERYSDDFKFAFQLVGQAAEDGQRIGEIAAFCRYFPEASQNPLRGSIVYGWGTLSESFRVFVTRLGLAGARKHTS